MATVTAAPGIPCLRGPDADLMSTIPDPRSRCVTPNPTRSGSATPSQHPDLSSEVASLSNKLINAINHQTNLDDSLAATRHELELSKDRIRQLEAVVQEHADMIAQGVLVRKKDVEDEMIQLMTRLAEERRQRGAAEKDKKNIEQELEALTTALFEEANKMVSAARVERDSTERRNEQLRSQLADTENLLISHQEQLAELKAVMQQMTTDREESEANTTISTTPSTPALGNRESKESLGKIFEGFHLSPNPSGPDEVMPSYPTSFSHLIHPVLRTDLQAYEDFNSLMRMPRNTSPGSRGSSGSYGGLNVMGLGGLSYNPSSSFGPFSLSGSSSSTPITGALTSSPSTTPTTPASTVSSASSRDVLYSLTPLKETRFYKRALVEDIEPTLRLDTAPGLSWLARRAVLSSMCEGSLVVEPTPTRSRLYLSACSLCGENRKDDDHVRRHRFRTSENDNVHRYPLCAYCLNRVRASCDFLGFLRMVKDGHWRTEGEEGEKAAWEESVRLRERMFWARIGGGVVPAFVPTPVHAKDSPRSPSAEDGDEAGKLSDSPLKMKSREEEKHEVDQAKADPFYSSKKRVSIAKTIICVDDDARPDRSSRAQPGDDRETSTSVGSNIAHTSHADEPQVGQGDGLRGSTDSNDSNALTNPELVVPLPRSEKRLSLTIPAALE
ncbi:MAG: rab guanine nucleotide exchange factor S2 [Trichoglossum hirsutum]|nr:MAG: rab guanine nucleotide exchange factor S2 [Trichoglossum hirsutum]